MPYDPVKDLTPIVNVTSGAFVMMAHPSFPANNVAELIALAKKQPGKIAYASSGAGGQQHLAMESVRSMAKIDLVHVPYKGFGQGVTDVLANQVPLIFGGVTASISYVGSGKLKALGVTSATRVKALPNVPAIAETLPGFDIVARPDFQERVAKDGNEPVGSTPEQFAAQIKADIERWAQVVKAAGIKPE
jgi:tripartite-type tricarboxylate transporter receptor subunit TctC